jgi:hypothetical protein
MPEPTWQPISALPLVAHHVEGTLAASEEQLATLGRARERPYLLDDATVARLEWVYTEQREDLWLFEEQVRRWRALELDEGRRARVEELAGKVARLREVNAAVLALAAELKAGTIERVLAMSDLELGLAALLRRVREP